MSFPVRSRTCSPSTRPCADVAVVGVPDEKFGQRLKAFVVLRDGQQASEEELKDHVGQRLARYKVPRDIEFLDELPRNATGKVLKKELKEDGDKEGSGESRATMKADGQRRSGKSRPGTGRRPRPE